MLVRVDRSAAWTYRPPRRLLPVLRKLELVLEHLPDGDRYRCTISYEPGRRWLVRRHANVVKLFCADRGYVVDSEAIGLHADLVARGIAAEDDFDQPFQPRAKAAIIELRRR